MTLDSMILDGVPPRFQHDLSDLPVTPLFRQSSSDKEPISMPELDFNGIDYLPEVLHEDAIMRYQLGSQGLFVSDDASYAYMHESTCSDMYFAVDLKLPCAVNMDRGGVVTRKDGTHAACIADGLGGGGYFSAFVAQGLCNFILKTLLEDQIGFSCGAKPGLSVDEPTNKQIVNRVFDMSFDSLDQLQNSPLSGYSTILFAECVATNKNRTYKLCVGALGDAAVIHIDSKTMKARQINKIHRNLGSDGTPDISNTGGYIDVDRGVRFAEKIEAKVVEIDEDDYVVLVTDGFLDNVLHDRIGEMVQLVAYHPFFDRPWLKLLSHNRFWENDDRPQLPTVEEMEAFIYRNSFLEEVSDKTLTAEKITRRLAAYTMIVTHSSQIKEQEFYEGIGTQPPFYRDTPKTDDAMVIVMSPTASKK